MKDSATQSTPVASTASRSLRSFSVSAPTGSSVSGRLTPFLSEILLPATTVQTIALPSLDTALSCSLPSSISSRSPASTDDRISGMRQMNARRVARRRIVVEREGLAERQLDAAVGELADAQLRPLQVGEDADRPADDPLRRRGCGRPASCIDAWSVWLMLMRKTSAPASNSFLIVSVSDDAGPSVARILTLRLRLIGPLCP